MGGEQAGRRKQICLCVAGLILLNLSACTQFGEISQTRSSITSVLSSKGNETREHLALARKFLAQGDYGGALRENEKVLALAGKRAPADEALFAIGIIYAYPANPARDYGKSIPTFRKLIKDHPQSFLTGQAKAILGLLQENDKLNRTIERLNNVIEELKAVDIGVEQKRRRETTK